MKKSEVQPRTTELISWKRQLGAVPLHNHAADVVEVDEDRVRITVKRTRPRFLVPPLSWVIRPRLEKTVQLDQLGTEVWRLCDGDRDVETIVDRFSAEHRLSFHEARVAVANYMKFLVERGAMVLVGAEQPAHGRVAAPAGEGRRQT